MCESTATPVGVWSDNTTWSCASAPAAGNCVDTIRITEHTYLADHVDLSGCPPVTLIVDDTLRFKAGKKLYLPAGSTIILHVGGWLIPEGGGGNSNLLDVGGTPYWTAGDGPLGGSSNLPVELLSFNANWQLNGVVVSWTTKSELNNDYFILERSIDGETYETIAKINGQGTSSETHQYEYLDEDVQNATYYYRLKQIDFDGDHVDYKPVAVKVESDNPISVYPNPTNGLIYLDQPFNGQVMVYNSLGQLVVSVNGNDQQTIDLSDLESGIYLVVIVENGQRSQQKIKRL